MLTRIFDIETDGIDATRAHFVVCFDRVDEAEVRRYAYCSADGRAALTPETVAWFGADNLLLMDNVADVGSADLLVGHSIIRYDCPVLAKLHRMKWSEDRVFDTAIMGSLYKPDSKMDMMTLLRERVIVAEDAQSPHSLRTWGKRIGVFKGQKPVDFEKPTDAMFRYCVQDVETTAALYDYERKGLVGFEAAMRLEHRFTNCMAEMERNGFCFDLHKASLLEATIRAERATLQAKLEAELPPKITVLKTKTKSEPFNPGSRQQVAAYFKGLGWEPTEFTDGGAPRVDDDVLQDLVGDYPYAAEIARYFVLTKLLGYLTEGDNSWLKHLKPDGRMHGAVITIGTPTMRCAHYGPNMGQVPAARRPYGKECRALFGPRSGWKLVGVDASGLQLRCLGHYLAPIDGGKYATIVSTGDPHTENQKAAGLSTRDQAKTFIYAWLFGAGAKKIGKVVDGTAKDGQRLISAFLRGLPQLKILKDRIDAAVTQRGYLFALDGRRLPIRKKHAALNALLMSAEAIIVKTATVLFRERMLAAGHAIGVDWGFCAHVHDEFQVECRPEIADEVAALATRCVTDAGTQLGMLCPLAGKAVVGNNWCDTH